MTAVVVRCPSCEQPSRVSADAVGQVVACPRCPHQFTAAPLAPPPPRSGPSVPPDIPVVHRRPRPTPPAEHPDDIPTVYPAVATGGPFAVALLPLGVPLLWLVLSLSVGPSEFSFMAAVAIAAGTVGLGLGLASVRRWSAGLRVRLLLVLTLLGYTSAALFYFAPPEWLERVREVAAMWGLSWRQYRSEDNSFQLLVPGPATDAPPPVPDWKLTTHQFVDPKGAVDVYIVAYGDASPKYGRWGDKNSQEVWFAGARSAIEAACEGKLAEERAVGVTGGVAREYVFDLASGKRRVVRLVRDDKKVFYLGVEGLYLSAERQDVKRYLRSFRLTPAGKRK